MVGASTHHQLRATKLKIMVGDLNPCSLRSREVRGQRAEGNALVLLPFVKAQHKMNLCDRASRSTPLAIANILRNHRGTVHR